MHTYTVYVCYHSFTYNVHVVWCEFGGCSEDAIGEVSVPKQHIEGSCGPFPMQFSAGRVWRWSVYPLGTSK
jgi:hypothetical protein